MKSVNERELRLPELKTDRTSKEFSLLKQRLAIPQEASLVILS
jgi:hypothetical protein